MSDVQVAERQSMYELRLRPYGAVYNELTGEVCLKLASWHCELRGGLGNVAIEKCSQDACSKRWLQSCFSDIEPVVLSYLCSKNIVVVGFTCTSCYSSVVWEIFTCKIFRLLIFLIV